MVFGALVMHRAFPCAPARGSSPCACTLFAEDRVAISFSFAAELWLWRSRLNVFFLPDSKLAVMPGFLAFVLLFDKEESSINVLFFGSRILYEHICFFVASWSLFSKFTTIHGFGPSIRSSFVLPVLRFCN